MITVFFSGVILMVTAMQQYAHGYHVREDAIAVIVREDVSKTPSNGDGVEKMQDSTNGKNLIHCEAAQNDVDAGKEDDVGTDATVEVKRTLDKGISAVQLSAHGPTGDVKSHFIMIKDSIGNVPDPGLRMPPGTSGIVHGFAAYGQPGRTENTVDQQFLSSRVGTFYVLEVPDDLAALGEKRSQLFPDDLAALGEEKSQPRARSTLATTVWLSKCERSLVHGHGEASGPASSCKNRNLDKVYYRGCRTRKLRPEFSSSQTRKLRSCNFFREGRKAGKLVAQFFFEMMHNPDLEESRYGKSESHTIEEYLKLAETAGLLLQQVKGRKSVSHVKDIRGTLEIPDEDAGTFQQAYEQFKEAFDGLPMLPDR